MTSSGLPVSVAAASRSSVDERDRVERALELHTPALYRYLVVRAGGDVHLADDLMQQLWFQAGSAGANVPDDELEFWFRGVARNLVRAHWRRQRNRPAEVPLADAALAAQLADRLSAEELPPQVLERREVRDQLLLAITSLGSLDQELIVGRYFRGLPLAELAREASMSPRAVEGRLYRARRTLQEELRELDS